MSGPANPWYRRLFDLLKAAAAEFGADMGSRFGAALSFYTLFSLIPLLFLVVAVVGFVSSESVFTPAPADNGGSACDSITAVELPATPENPLDRVIGQVDDVAGSQISGQLAQLTCQASASRNQALWIGLGLAVFSGSSVFLHVQGILNHIFGASEERTRGFVNALIQRGIAVGWAVVLAVAVFVPLVAVGAVNLIRSLVPDQLGPILGVGVPLSSLLLLVVVVSLTFRLLTRVEVSWQAARRGGMFTAVTGLAGAFLVGLYLRSFGAAGALGALGGVAILLFFFNLMWIIYLFGAEVTKVYAAYLQHGDMVAPSQRPTPLQLPARDEDVARPPSVLSGGVGAFLLGLITGWFARRK